MRSRLALDRVATAIVLVAAALLVRYAWERYPTPREGGTAVLGVAAALAAALFFRKPAGRPLFGSALAAAAAVLAVQALLQGAAARGLI